MVEIIDQRVDFKNLPEITNPVTFDAKGPTPDGLYSELIFKTSIKDTSSNFAYINLGTTIIQPIIYENLNKLDPIFKKVIDPSSNIKVVLTGGMLQEAQNGKRGIGWLFSVWDQIDFDQYKKEGIKDFSYKFKKAKKEDIFINKWIVIPPLYRPWIEDKGIKKEDEITGLYKDILRVTNSKKGQNPFMDKILDNASKPELIQSRVNALYKHIINLINKSDGLQEGKLIGKRMNNVARLTANAHPKMPIDAVGVPWHTLLGLLDTLVIAEINHNPNRKQIIEALELNEITTPEEWGKYFDYIYRNAEVYVADDKGKKKRQILIDVLENVINTHPSIRIILKRDPAWDKNSYHSLKPVIITDNAYHVVPNSMIYIPLAGDSFTTKICGQYKKLKDRVLYKKQTTNKKFSFTVRLKSDKALIMKSMKYFIEKESK